MKSKIFFITTLILILVQLLSLLVFAVEDVTYLPTSSTITYSTSAGGTIETALNLYSKDELPSSDLSVIAQQRAGQFDYYYRFLATLDNTSHFTAGTFNCNFENMNFKGYNSLSFDVSLFVHPQNTDYKSNFSIILNDDTSFDDYTLLYTVSNVVTYTSPNGTVYSYRKLYYTIIFDEPYRYDTLNLNFVANTYLPPTGVTTAYCFGINPLKAELLTEDEINANIAGSVSNIETELGVLNEQTVIISNDIDKIKEILSDTLTSEEESQITSGKESIENNSVILADRNEVINDIDNELNIVFKYYEDIEYDVFGDHYGEYVTEYIDPVFNDAGFMGFWNGLFSHPFVMALVITSITFCGIGFAFYGTR